MIVAGRSLVLPKGAAVIDGVGASLTISSGPLSIARRVRGVGGWSIAIGVTSLRSTYGVHIKRRLDCVFCAVIQIQTIGVPAEQFVGCFRDHLGRFARRSC